MKENLILLTNYYPFHKGEEYLETEIEYLKKAFDTITIVPTMVRSDMKQTRNVPANVRVIGLVAPQGIRDKIGNFVKYVPKVFGRKEIMSHIKHESKLNLYKWAYNLYFESRAISVYKRLMDRIGLPKHDNENRVTIYSYWFYITANIGIKLKENYYRDPNIKIISRGHGYDVNDYIKPFSFLPERTYMLEKIDTLFTVSKTSRDYLRNKYKKYQEKIETAPLGVIRNKFQKSSRTPFKVVSCSTIRKLKRIDITIVALKALEDANIPYHYTHIGDGPERDEIKALARKTLKEENYTFTGAMSNEAVSQWFKNNQPDVFINTSSSEGVPVSIMEALAYATPIIASDVGGTKEVVYTGVNGVLLKNYEDIDEVSNALIKLATMEESEYQDLRYQSYNVWKNERNAAQLYTEFSENLKNHS